MTGLPGMSRQKRSKSLDAYHTQVIEWEAADHPVHIIYEKRQGIDYTGVYGAVKVFIAELRKRKRAKAPLGAEYHSQRDIPVSSGRIIWKTVRIGSSSTVP